MDNANVGNIKKHVFYAAMIPVGVIAAFFSPYQRRKGEYHVKRMSGKCQKEVAAGS